MTSEAPAPAPVHEHEYHALWSHLGPLGRQDIHYHPCTEAEPGECYVVLVGYGVDCDGKRATHAACELPVPNDLVIPGEPQPAPAPAPAGAPGWLAEVKALLAERDELLDSASYATLERDGLNAVALAERVPALVAALEAVLAHAGRWEGSVTGARYAKIVREAVAAELASPYPGAEVLRRIDAAAVADDDLDDFDAAEAARDTQGGAANG